MPIVLINGISTAGKSSAVIELKERGYTAYDLEHIASSGWYNKRSGQRIAGFNEAPERSKEWLQQHEWRVSETAVQELAAQAQESVIYIAGGAANEDVIAALCDKVIWLKTDEATIRSRITMKRDHDYGTKPHELEKILNENAIKEERQKNNGAIIIDARQPLSAVVDNILSISVE